MIKRDTPESIKLDSMGLEEDFLLTHGFKDVMLEPQRSISGRGGLVSKTHLFSRFAGSSSI
jgi:hypothetical protein